MKRTEPYKSNNKNYNSVFLLPYIKENHREILDCNCESQRCCGKYIKTMDFQITCSFDTLEKQTMYKEQKYTIVKPNTEFPLYTEYEKYFKLNEGTIFAFDNKIYTTNDLPEDYIEHEKVHLRQQNNIGCDNWVALYMRNKEFRLKQELEAYRYQLSVIKDKNKRSKAKTEFAKILSSEMYGNMVTEEEAKELLKE